MCVQMQSQRSQTVFEVITNLNDIGDDGLTLHADYPFTLSLLLSSFSATSSVATYSLSFHLSTNAPNFFFSFFFFSYVQILC